MTDFVHLILISFPIFQMLFYRCVIVSAVTIQHLHKKANNQTIALHCEAQVCVLLFCTVTDNTLRNVAKLKPSFQVSGQYGQHPARNANDGNEQTCAVSEPASNPWWAVDLGGPTLVFMVKLTNSGDGKGTCHWMLMLS